MFPGITEVLYSPTPKAVREARKNCEVTFYWRKGLEIDRKFRGNVAPADTKGAISNVAHTVKCPSLAWVQFTKIDTREA